jgi:hypothetical protein
MVMKIEVVFFWFVVPCNDAAYIFTVKMEAA